MNSCETVPCKKLSLYIKLKQIQGILAIKHGFQALKYQIPESYQINLVFKKIKLARKFIDSVLFHLSHNYTVVNLN